MVNDVVGKLVADKYRVESLISESEDGDLYLCRHEVLDKPVTLKVLSPALAIDPRWVKRFVDEARSASVLKHPNILAITDFGTDAKGITYAVFEELAGISLAELLGGGLVLDESRALAIADRIAAAVTAAHAKQVTHGTLSPKQIYVDNQGPSDVVKVNGFGHDPTAISRDADPRYLAPEQCSAYPSADARVDVYALGVILYQMLSGGVPFEGSTPAEVLDKQNSEPPAPLSAFRRDLRPEVEPIVLSAIAADPDRRYQTMSAFAEDLDRLTGSTDAGKPAAVSTSPKQHNIWQTAFIVLAGVTLLAVALIYGTSTRRTDPTVQTQTDPGSFPVQPIGPATGAQEESLAKLPAQTDADILASASQQNGNAIGGDGYNAWANGGVPPPGAPLNSAASQNNGSPGYVPPGGQTMTIQNGGSQFMPSEVLPAGCTMLPSGVVLCPKPLDATATKPSPTPRNSAANSTGTQEKAPVSTPRPLPAQTPPGSKAPTTQQPSKPAGPPPAGTTTSQPVTGP